MVSARERWSVANVIHASIVDEHISHERVASLQRLTRACPNPIADPRTAKERVRPVLEAMGAQGIVDFGEEVGAATLVKIVGNFLIVSAQRESGLECAAMALRGKKSKPGEVFSASLCYTLSWQA